MTRWGVDIHLSFVHCHHQVADVDDNCTRNVTNVDPFAGTIFHLQAPWRVLDFQNC